MAPYRLMPPRPVASCMSFEVTARSADATLDSMAQRNEAIEKFSSVVLPTATPPTMGMRVSHTSLEYRRPKKSVRRITEHAGSPAFTTRTKRHPFVQSTQLKPTPFDSPLVSKPLSERMRMSGRYTPTTRIPLSEAPLKRCRANERTNKRANERADERTSERTNERVNAQTLPA